MKHLSKLALLAAAFFTGLSANAQSINAFGGQSVTISSDQTCTSFDVLDGSTLTVNQGVTLTLNISNGYAFNFFDNSNLELHGTLAGSVASGATWMDNTYINVYLSDGAKYTVTGLTCMDGDNYLRYYGYDAATDGNGTVSVTSGSTAVTASSTGYKATTYTFTATPSSGYRFVNWTKGAGGEVLGTDASINVTCEQNGTYQVYANFEQDAPAATNYDLTVGESAHGTVAFTVDGTAATQAKKDDVVTVSVTPAEGYSAKDVTVRAYTSWEAASEILTGGGDNPGLVSDINVTKQENGTWTFTMPEANVWVVVTYAKNLQDAWIQAIADQTYTGSAIEPTVTVKDGETTLVLNTDYTVAYSDNTAAGTATVTITAVEGSNYSGTATKTFTIVKADITMTTAPAAVSGLVYSGEAQTLITAGVASFGTVVYSLDGENFSDALPQATDAGTYTVTYKVEGDDNHNAFAAQTMNVTIATNKTALNTAITEAEAYYNSISESNPDAAAVLLTAINAAKGVQDNADATQSEIETAAQTLTNAVNAAKADVALKRITLVIPAKSYMARIDADKRQIETAVDGVKLYTVKSVTNTEVELTAELNVIAAEMPYFIYNDNDTEVEVSIVVSSEDADNVAYDSEHFKGTLVDKTFTDEDMEVADHYVLTGHNFVWVKDAGTLAAGKCWIELVPSSPAHARALSIVFEGETTGISTVKTDADTKDAVIYDLQGRRVMQPTKGLFIVNGKKVVIK